jgi:NaMN:DMB phosphoribosyltransferase
VERERVGWIVREGVGAGGEMTQALYAHMNNKTIKKVSIMI